MTRKIRIENLNCLCCRSAVSDTVAYIIYPMDFLDGWIENAVKRYGTSIVVITGMEWQDAMSPWPAKGVPKGCPDFKGEAPEFLSLLRQKVIPTVESALGLPSDLQRTLVGVSMSGLFTLWQWMLSDLFANIASLSGSFWYEGFADWMKSRIIPHKTGRAYFLLGNQEPHSRVKAFDSVGVNTLMIISLLQQNGIDTQFQSVPGNHYANPIPRLDAAFSALFSSQS